MACRYQARYNLLAGNYIGTNVTGDSALGNYDGVAMTYGSGNTVGGSGAGAGNLISGNKRNGVELTGTTGSVVAGNFIGTNADGSAALANARDGVEIDGAATGDTIGGTAAGAGNLISGNVAAGVGIYSVTPTDIVIVGNRIGTNADGTAGIANYYGVDMDNGASGNTVGGTVAGAGNLISGNSVRGLYISSDNLIWGNLIGTNADGTAAISNGVGITTNLSGNTIGGTTMGAGNVISGNSYENVQLGGDSNLLEGNFIGTTISGDSALGGGDGVVIYESGNTVGGTASGAGNVISGNLDNGVEFNDADDDATDNVVAGNFIGTDSTGKLAIANLNDGVKIDAGVSGNTIGGTTSGTRNVISGNTNDGVEISGAGTTGNVVTGDYIGTDITGTVAIANGTGVKIGTSASGNTIGGLTSTPGTGAGNVISGNATGVSDTGGGDDLILGNLVGTNAAGTAAVGNTLDGIDVGTSGDTIGGSTASARNVISGNTAGFGIDLSAQGNVVQGNFIGVGITGLKAIGNSTGIVVVSGNETIGGPTATPGTVPGNVIAGNQDGIEFYNDGTAGNAVEGNLIGLGADGSTAVGNTNDGIYVALSSLKVTIGGAAAADRNVISANYFGIFAESEATGLVIQSNYVGTDVTGSLARGNGYLGVYVLSSGAVIGGLTATPGTAPVTSSPPTKLVSASAVPTQQSRGTLLGATASGVFLTNAQATGIDIGSNGNTLGGTAAGAGNLISGNSVVGVELNAAAANNLIAGNLVGTNLAGGAAVPDGLYGVFIGGSASANTVGGTVAASEQPHFRQRRNR